MENTDSYKISDGYHTFQELYNHRHSLVLALMSQCPENFWYSRRHSDGELCFGSGDWFIVGATLPEAGQISYHLPIELWGLASGTGAMRRYKGEPWDGHTSEDVVNRLREWASGRRMTKICTDKENI